MHSKGQGLLASLLMFIPLLAVPFVASIGVPWLSAKAKEEGVPLPDLTAPTLLSPGVGQSQSGRHSTEDLFAPVVRQAAVDLRLASQGSLSAEQNPHLRNASLVISHNPGWIDPFEAIKTAETQSQVPTASEIPLQGWAVQEPGSDFGPDEAPVPQEFFDAANENTELPLGENPFENPGTSDLAPTQSSDSLVAVLDSAFEDPIAQPRVNKDPGAFDPAKGLFKPPEATQATAPPAREIEPKPQVNPIKVAANSVNNIRTTSEPLSWESARIRLSQYGIKDYYLQPNPSQQVFHFHCSYTPPDNPRIKRVFEAEDPVALEAVRKVLAQLDSWTQRQVVNEN